MHLVELKSPYLTQDHLNEQNVALFDAVHGQANWAQTGFDSRLMTTRFAGVAEIIHGCSMSCATNDRKPVSLTARGPRLLVIPPPTGTYDADNERWHSDAETLFETEEICSIIRYLHDGGRLLGFAYRFGDSFTQSNLGQLVAPLGCLLNDDAIVDLHRIQHHYPLECYFETDRDMMPLTWAAAGVNVLRWRSMATFTILPGSHIRPLVLSPGGACISYNRTHRYVSFQSHPVAVAGTYGAGRFALFGGPHAFETGQLGLLAGDQQRALLGECGPLALSDGPAQLDATISWAGADDFALRDQAQQCWHDLAHVEPTGNGAQAIALVERVLLESDIPSRPQLAQVAILNHRKFFPKKLDLRRWQHDL